MVLLIMNFRPLYYWLNLGTQNPILTMPIEPIGELILLANTKTNKKQRFRSNSFIFKDSNNIINVDNFTLHYFYEKMRGISFIFKLEGMLSPAKQSLFFILLKTRFYMLKCLSNLFYIKDQILFKIFTHYACSKRIVLCKSSGKFKVM